MSAPTTAEVRARIERLQGYAQDRESAERNTLATIALPLAEERDAQAAEATRRGELLAAERERYAQLQATLDAERRASTERSVAYMDEVARLQAAAAESREAAAFWMESAKDWRERR